MQQYAVNLVEHRGAHSHQLFISPWASCVNRTYSRKRCLDHFRARLTFISLDGTVRFAHDLMSGLTSCTQSQWESVVQRSEILKTTRFFLKKPCLVTAAARLLVHGDAAPAAVFQTVLFLRSFNTSFHASTQDVLVVLDR